MPGDILTGNQTQTQRKGETMDEPKAEMKRKGHYLSRVKAMVRYQEKTQRVNSQEQY